MTCVDDWILPGKSLDYPFFVGEKRGKVLFSVLVFAMMRDEAKGAKGGEMLFMWRVFVFSFEVVGLGVYGGDGRRRTDGFGLLHGGRIN